MISSKRIRSTHAKTIAIGLTSNQAPLSGRSLPSAYARAHTLSGDPQRADHRPGRRDLRKRSRLSRLWQCVRRGIVGSEVGFWSVDWVWGLPLIPDGAG